MSWIAPAPGGSPLEHVLGHRPELLTGYRAFYQALWQDGPVPRRILALCRLRIAAIHGCEAEWQVRDPDAGIGDSELEALARGDFSAFVDTERAALAVAEQMPFAHHQIGDAEVAALERLLGAPAAVTLLTALAFFDVACRLKLVLDIEPARVDTDAPPLCRGALV
jgi:alkylhydroperoxidase family enzyme